MSITRLRHRSKAGGESFLPRCVRALLLGIGCGLLSVTASHAQTGSGDGGSSPEQPAVLGQFLGLLWTGPVGPIGWRGVLAYDWDQVNYSSGKNQSVRQSLALDGGTYIAHPAILSLRGTLALSRNETRTEPNAIDRDQASTTGSLFANGLSRTAVPFNLSYQVSDSATEGLLVREDFRRQDWRYQQQYRPFGAPYSAQGSLTQTTTEAATGLRFDSLESALGFTTGFGEGHSFRVNSSYRDIEASDGTGNSAWSSSLAHDFALEYYYRVSNTLRHSWTASETVPGDQVTSNTGQYYNAVMWIPSDDYPLTLNSGITVDWLDLGAAEKTRILGGSLTADYRLSDRATVLGGIALQHRKAGDLTFRSTTGNVSSSYRGESRELWGYQHDWGANANASLSTFSDGQSSSLSASASQSLYKSIVDDAGRSWTLSGNQSGGWGLTSYEQAGDVTRTSPFSLSHAATVGFSTVDEEGRSFAASGSLQDARTFDSLGDSAVQTVTATANGAMAFSRVSFLDASIAWATSHVSRKRPDDGGDVADWTNSGVGQVSYRHQKPFGLRRTSYRATLRLNARDEFDADEFTFDYSFDHAIENRIGLLSTSLRNDYAWDVNGNLTWAIRFRIARAF